MENKGKIPIERAVIGAALKNLNISSLSSASIREIVRAAGYIEKKCSISFVRMEMGIPGLPPPKIGVDAEIKALRNGVASKYPNIEGIPELKLEIANFAKLFLDINVPPEACFPTVGSMQGTFAVFMTALRRDKKKTTTLFIDPGFPVQKQQHRALGLKYVNFDIYNFRGKKLRIKLESFLKSGKISSVVYSNPNNPSWICLDDEELRIIGDLCDKYDVIAVEDLAYFAMDFRKDYSSPGKPPFQPTVAKYCDNYVILVSSSKIFSYAGQRIGAMIISEKLSQKKFPDLEKYFQTTNFRHALVYGALYALSSGTTHSSQFSFAAMLNAVNTGKLHITAGVKEYGNRAGIMKKIFIENGFKLVYDKDGDKPIADGFYFTLSYPGMNAEELLRELFRYGVSAIALKITGSRNQEGIRACVSLSDSKAIAELKKRMKIFKENHRRYEQR